MKTNDMLNDNPMVRNPLKFEDVAYGAYVRWCVSEKSALKFFKAEFQTPREANACLIAAAPGLVAAFQRIIDAQPRVGASDLTAFEQFCIEQACAALAEVRGKA